MSAAGGIGGRERVDAVIVGAGAAGSFFAARLAAAGKSVVVLEAGPGWKRSDLTSSMIDARRLKGDAGEIELKGANPWGYSFNAGRGLGGAALHHYAVWPRLAPEDFNVKSAHGRGLDWPIDYATLRPWYDRIQREVGIAGDAEAEVWRGPGEPYPMPPHPTLAGGAVLKRGFDKLGIRTAPVPLAINSRDYNNRPACIYDGWCEAGCPTGALANPLVLHIPQARAAGAEFRVGARVTKILSEGKDSVSGVEYLDSSGATRTQLADMVILAAAPIENPRLMLVSANDHHPVGIGNRAGLVGRYFMSHPLAIIHGLFADDTAPYAGITGGQLTSRDGYGKAKSDGLFGSYQWVLATAIKPNDLTGIAISRPDLFGAALDKFMRHAVDHYAQMVGFAEELPDADNRVTLGDAKGADGLPVARLTHTLSPDTQSLWAHIQAEGLKIYKAAGSESQWGQPMVFAHAMGGTIMGETAADSVADSYGRVHEMRNLVVAGSGLFPTAGAVNPTYTIYALAARTADHMLRHWADYAG